MFFVFREGAGYPEGHHEECDAGEEQTGSGSSPEAIGTVRSAGPFAAEGEEVSETKSHAPEEYAVNKHWSESDAVASQCKTAHRLHGVKDVVEAPEKQERRSEIMNRRLAGIEPDNRSAKEIKHERGEDSNRKGEAQRTLHGDFCDCWPASAQTLRNQHARGNAGRERHHVAK